VLDAIVFDAALYLLGLCSRLSRNMNGASVLEARSGQNFRINFCTCTFLGTADFALATGNWMNKSIAAAD